MELFRIIMFFSFGKLSLLLLSSITTRLFVSLQFVKIERDVEVEDELVEISWYWINCSLLLECRWKWKKPQKI